MIFSRIGEIFNPKKKWENFGGNANIYDNLNRSDIPRLFEEPKLDTLQFFEFKTPSEKTWKF